MTAFDPKRTFGAQGQSALWDFVNCPAAMRKSYSMAQDLYCWRCDMVVPMLTEPEWEAVQPALNEAILDVQKYRAAHGATLKEALVHGHGESALRLYRELTGYGETNPSAIWHHRLSIYGPPCKRCGKPLRTPQASLCAACGASA